jgi:choline dehydrogenase
VLLPEAGGGYQCAYCDVPIMQARASEDADMRWDFFVRHYVGDAVQRRDGKFVAAEDGVLYPRGAPLGGSTATSGLVTIYPNNSDWDHIAELTGDESWRADLELQRAETIRPKLPRASRRKQAIRCPLRTAAFSVTWESSGSRFAEVFRK